MGVSVSVEDFKPIMIYCVIIAITCTNLCIYGLCLVEVKVNGLDEFKHSRI